MGDLNVGPARSKLRQKLKQEDCLDIGDPRTTGYLNSLGEQLLARFQQSKRVFLAFGLVSYWEPIATIAPAIKGLGLVAKKSNGAQREQRVKVLPIALETILQLHSVHDFHPIVP